MIDQRKINFNRLRRSKILVEFVKKHHGCWSHEDWAGLCRSLLDSEYNPLDFDRIGLYLQDLKRDLNYQ